MSFDINNNYRGTFFGKDRLGFVTPDCDASEPIQPYLPVGYPAPWLPIKRRDEGHPVGAGIVISSHQLVGVDKSGGLIPAGLISGPQPATSAGGRYCLIKYGPDDVGFTINPRTGVKVAAAGEYVLLAAPSNAQAGDVVDGISITAADITFANSCDLVPGSVARAIGYALRNVMQFIGGVDILDTTGGIKYVHRPSNPAKYTVHNYIHEMATAVRTSFVVRLPWIGATPSTLQQLAQTLNITGYTQTDWSRSFAHFTGAAGSAYGQLFPGCSVVPSDRFGAVDAGNYAPYDPNIHKPDQICGRVLGVEMMYPIRDYADRVRTQFERGLELVGPFRESNPVQMMMGGSATRGMDYAINVTTNGIFRLAVDQGKTILPEFATYVYVKVSC